MSVVMLPTGRGAPRFRYRIELDAKEYGLTMTWNERAEGWFLDVRDAEGQLLRGGVRVVKDWPLLERGGDDRLPPGQLLALAAGRDDLSLVYVEAGS